MTPSLPSSFRRCPLAHRALHDVAQGRPENSLGAVKAAVALGYGIEIDVQLTADKQAVVFHDYELSRLTNARGAVHLQSAAYLANVRIEGTLEGVPNLTEILEAVNGKVPVLIEIKDQDGALGPDVGTLESVVAKAVDGYLGDLAVMSFNPHSVAAMQTLVPSVPRGLTTETFRSGKWPIPKPRLEELAQISDYARVGACFISHRHRVLDTPRVAELKAAGATILCWTVRSAKEDSAARKFAHNVTFEGYLPEIEF